MSYPNAMEICRAELFTKTEELQQRYNPQIVEKVVRVREMYNWFLANPDASDREFVAEVCSRHGIHRTTAYNDLGIVKTLLPLLGAASKEFHLWRSTQMLMSAYKMAERRKDAKTMERAATSYAKVTGADNIVDNKVPYDQIVPQHFTATDDPRVLGIEPIPNLDQQISKMLDKYRADSIDIDDVDFEEVDLEFDVLFPDKKDNANESEESIL